MLEYIHTHTHAYIYIEIKHWWLSLISEEKAKHVYMYINPPLQLETSIIHTLEAPLKARQLLLCWRDKQRKKEVEIRKLPTSPT